MLTPGPAGCVNDKGPSRYPGVVEKCGRSPTPHRPCGLTYDHNSACEACGSWCHFWLCLRYWSGKSVALRLARPDSRGVCVCLFHGVYEGVGPHVVSQKKRRGKNALVDVACGISTRIDHAENHAADDAATAALAVCWYPIGTSGKSNHNGRQLCWILGLGDQGTQRSAQHSGGQAANSSKAMQKDPSSAQAGRAGGSWSACGVVMLLLVACVARGVRTPLFRLRHSDMLFGSGILRLAKWWGFAGL